MFRSFRGALVRVQPGPMPDDLPTRPSQQELAAYWNGSLDLHRFDQVDAWVASLPPQEQDLLAAQVVEHSGDLSSLAPDLNSSSAEPFQPEIGKRFVPGDPLGSGGMGTVIVLHDRVLEREVAIKRIRPRQRDEPLDAYLTRVRAFKREAAITAKLEHPGIVPVHDVGLGSAGEPAFTMKRLDGEPLSVLVDRRRDGAPLDLARVISVILRVAEAIAYAHERGVVHRDVKPDNVIVGALGAVSVIDWGLAALTDKDGGAHSATSWRVGTHPWMAPEQFDRDLVDPRVDVFALGGLMMAVLTGRAPRGVDGRELDLTPLAARGLPQGLVAVIRRCLAMDPAQRYANGSAVAAELQRWLTAGLTLAQEPSVLRRIVSFLRRSPALVVGLVVGAFAIASGVAWMGWHHEFHHREMRDRVQTLAAQVPLDDAEALRTAHGELQGFLHDFPEERDARDLDTRFAAALETLQRTHQQTTLQQRLDAITHTYRVSGPWTSQAHDVLAALAMTGVQLTDAGFAENVDIIAHHPLRVQILAALVELQQVVLMDKGFLAPDLIPRLLRASAPSPGWIGLAGVLTSPIRRAHDLTFADGPDSEAALSDAATADLMLALFGPEHRLVQYAQARLVQSPGDFWSRVICARAALMTKDRDSARSNALVALGAEPSSIWPHLVLAYLALSEGHDDALAAEVAAGLLANPNHIELKVLKAVVDARRGHLPDAQKLVDSLDASHLQYHLQHLTGHPMDASVQALVAAGITIPAASPAIGPVVPHEH